MTINHATQIDALKAIGAETDGFAEFWRGYLLGLAFTASIDSENGGESVYNNPGGDIADVVDLDELEERIGAADLVDLLLDAIHFLRRINCYLQASIEKNEGDYESAGTDFHYNRNGHGCGFWDGDWPTYGGMFSKLAKQYQPAEFYQSEDGESFYIMRG